MKSKILLIPGILVIAFYCIFTLISLSFFPTPFSFIDNRLSDLGNFTYNSQGAIFYNLGCILTGSALFPFYIGLFAWYRKELWHKIFMIITQIIGCYSGLVLIMLGISTEDPIVHDDWSQVFCLLNLILMEMASFFLLFNRKFNELIGYYGCIVPYISILFVYFFEVLAEWFTFFLLVYVALILYNTNKILD